MIILNHLEQRFGRQLLFTQSGEVKIRQGVNYLIGANGAGKTTFLKMLTGVIPPTSGFIQYNGTPVEQALESIGIVFDQPHFYPYLTGLENLYFFNDYSVSKVSKREIQQLFDYWNVGDKKTKYKHYSLGMKKKLSLVFSLMRNPDFWLLDEPFNALDMDAQYVLHNKIKDMKNNGKTVILSTHNIENHFVIADHLIVIYEKSIRYYPNAADKLPIVAQIGAEQTNQPPLSAILNKLEMTANDEN